MNNIATTIEQSRRLLELGLSPESADMYWSITLNIPVPYLATKLEHQIYKEGANLIPCWSLGALLELMPTDAHIEKRKNNYACYIVYTKPYEANTPIEAAYNMVVWLLENNYIKKEKI